MKFRHRWAGAALVGVTLGAATSPVAFAGGSFTGLGDLAGGSFFSNASGVSADGAVVVGGSYSANGSEAFRWTQGGGMVGLGDLAGGGFSSGASGVSADGSVVVGGSYSANGSEAFRWTQGGGMAGLGDLAGGGFYSSASGVSADGSVVVGQSNSANGSEAFRWTQGGGMVGLGDLAGSVFGSSAQGVSADGSVVVGNSIVSDYSCGQYGENTCYLWEAFRWSQGGGMVGLGYLAGGVNSNAYGVSADGAVVVGQSSSTNGSEAFRWTQGGGMQSVADWLAAAGVAVPQGWTLNFATGISADGSVIVGYGVHNGVSEAWRAEVTAVPEAESYAYMAAGLGLVGWIARRRKAA